MQMTKEEELKIIDEMKKEGYVLLSAAAEKTRYNKRQIRKLCEVGRIRYKKLYVAETWVHLKDVIQYAAAHPPKELNPTWDEIDLIEGEVFYPLFGYDCKYATTNKNRVVNLTNGQVLKGCVRESDGYTIVCLMQNGKRKDEYLHRLIGITQCPNVLGKNVYHHIKNKKPLDNSARNILPVWDGKNEGKTNQHDELHDLLRKKDTRAYKRMIKEIKKENREKIHRIKHPYYSDDKNFKYYMYISATGYKEYKKTGNIKNNEIIRETAELDYSQ